MLLLEVTIGQMRGQKLTYLMLLLEVTIGQMRGQKLTYLMLLSRRCGASS